MRLVSVAALVLLLAPSGWAQLVLDKQPGDQIFIPKRVEEEEPTEPEKPLYSGDPIQLPSECRRPELAKLGLDCSEAAPCELFLELVDVQPGDEGRIYLIANLSTSSSVLAGVLLVSEDQGASWSDAADRIGAGAFEKLLFFEHESGWAAGQAVGESVSRAPFLLGSDDGGKNWTRYPVWAGPEERSGSILDLYFDSPDHGFLSIETTGSSGDPFELYESVTGGASWSIREITSERPRIRRSRRIAADPTWRIGENPAQGVYEVQRLEDGSWKTAGRFAVTLGACAVVD
jgi:hypothetical protein